MVYSSRSIYIARLVYSTCLAVLMGILAQAIIYIGPVPYTMQNVGVILSGLLLPSKYALFSQLLYLLLIALGLPMGAGFRGGLHVLLGYTGGYLAGFPISATLMSVFCRMYLKRRNLDLGRIGLKDYIVLLALSSLAILPTYVLGFLVFMHYALQNERLFSWAIGVAQKTGVSSGTLAILFTASVAVFVPQDLLIDHVVAVAIAKIFARFLKSRGIEIE